MSIAATAWAWGVDVSPSAKLVLLALADRADAEGECFPSVADVVRRTNLGERTVQRELKALESAGLLQRRIRALKSSYFVLSIGKDCNRGASVTGGATVAGGASVAPRGVTVAPIIITEPKEDTSTYVGTLSADAPRPASPPQAKKGTRIADDWQPKDRATADALGINTDEAVAEFRDYWRGVPGKAGIKLDWEATWRNQVRFLARNRRTDRPAKSSQWPVADQNAEMMRLLARARAEEETQPMLRSIA